jgi:SAM-dependent methyltransferase
LSQATDHVILGPMNANLSLAPPPVGAGGSLNFNSPLSATRAAGLVRPLGAVLHASESDPPRVLDVGCGWGQLLLDILSVTDHAEGMGVDTFEPDIERARTSADRRGLGDRTEFEARKARTDEVRADVVLNIGAFQAFGSITEALGVLRELVRPGGRVLFGCEYWEHVPSAAELTAMWEDTTAQDAPLLADLVDHALAAGFRLDDLQTVTAREWEEFECGHMRDRELWLAAHPSHPEAQAVRAQLDSQRSIWLRGYRGVMGFAYVTLVPTAD